MIRLYSPQRHELVLGPGEQADLAARVTSTREKREGGDEKAENGAEGKRMRREGRITAILRRFRQILATH